MGTIGEDELSEAAKIRYRLEGREFGLGNELMLRSRVPLGSIVFTSVLFGAALSLLLGSDSVGRIQMAIRIVLISLAVFASIMAIMKLNRGRIRRKSAANHDISPFAGQWITAEWNDKGITLTTENGHQLYPWKDFTGFAEDREVITLFFGPHLYLPIPKRAMNAASRRDMDAWLQKSGLERKKLFPI